MVSGIDTYTGVRGLCKGTAARQINLSCPNGKPDGLMIFRMTAAFTRLLARSLYIRCSAY